MNEVERIVGIFRERIKGRKPDVSAYESLIIYEIEYYK